MLNLTVRNVGQGDCIVLRWKNDAGEEEMGIIDCKDHDMGPLLDEIVKVKTIRFILLTHPHDDHYSGLPELLNYCYKTDHAIEVDKIYHTTAFNPAFLMRAINYPRERKLFSKLLRELDQIHRSDTIKTTCELMVSGVTLDLNANLKISCLAPDLNEEVRKFTSVLYDDKEDRSELQKRVNNPYGNYLSTVLLISSPRWEILLTSDAVNTTFERLSASDTPAVSGPKRIILGQVPHHGSLQGHFPVFWNPRINREGSHTFISSGRTTHFQHPHCDVVKFFNHASQLAFTNYSAGMEECSPEDPDAQMEFDTGLLDFISEPVEAPLSYSKDVRFSIDEDGRVERG